MRPVFLRDPFDWGIQNGLGKMRENQRIMRPILNWQIPLAR